MGRRIHRVVNVSGGKDSTALYLWMLEQGRPYRAVFADVMNEAPETYEYVSKLSERSGGPEVETVRADFTRDFETRRRNIPVRWRKEGVPEERIERALELLHPTGNVFLDLCMLRSGFPTAKRRYCTDYLKIRPINRQVLRPIWESGGIPATILGVRADESFARSLARRIERKTELGVPRVLWRPLLDWTVSDVLATIKRHGMPLNPLYALGMNRVGCLPCIFARKNEIALIARHHPEAVDRIAEWEALVESVSKGDGATFFYARAMKGPPPPWKARTHGIRLAVEWARTSHGGKQYAMDLGGADGEVQRAWNVECAGQGLCE